MTTGLRLVHSARMADPVEFEEINVQRLNVREPDGRLRYVLSNRERLPGLIMRGREWEHDRPQAGMLFYNDEETESGGLIFDGRDGSSGGSLTFDAYERDQVVQLLGDTEDGRTRAGMVVTDRPAQSMVDLLPQLESDGSSGSEGPDTSAVDLGSRRLFVGQLDGDAVLNLCDGEGHVRLRLRVTTEGEAAIEFLTPDGHVQRAIAPEGL